MTICEVWVVHEFTNPSAYNAVAAFTTEAAAQAWADAHPHCAPEGLPVPLDPPIQSKDPYDTP